MSNNTDTGDTTLAASTAAATTTSTITATVDSQSNKSAPREALVSTYTT